MLISGSRRLLSLAGLAATVLAAGSREAIAQLGCSGGSCTIEISMPVNDVLRISLSSSGIALGAPSELDYAAGFRDVSGAAVTASVKANRPFQVQVSGGGASFAYAGAHPDPAKPASDLRWATAQGGLASTTNHMGVAGMLMNQGASGNAQAALYLRTLWDITRDVPGTYSMSIRFTLSAP